VIKVHSLAHVDLAHAGQRDLQRSLDARVARTAVTETARTLEPVTRDPFINDLDDATPGESPGVDIGCAPEAVSERELHERQRTRVRASLLAVPGPAKPMHRRWAEPLSATRR
jgi:hypothetical protein